MRYAVLENGAAVNIIACDDPVFAASMGWIEIPAGRGRGDLFDGTYWTIGAPSGPEPEPMPPEPTLEERVAGLELLVDQLLQRVKALEGGV